MDLRLFMKDYTIVITWGKLVRGRNLGMDREFLEPVELYHKFKYF